MNKKNKKKGKNSRKLANQPSEMRNLKNLQLMNKKSTHKSIQNKSIKSQLGFDRNFLC